MNKKQIALALGIMCLILTMTIVVQVRTTNNTNKVVSQTFTSNDLRDQVLKWKERYDSTYSALQTSESRLEEVRQQASENTEGSTEGVIVTLRDNPNVSADSTILDPSLAIVHYSDLLDVVSELKNAGAEAISVNDQRVVATTAINCEGNVININGEKISSPFVIKAIGSSVYMYSALMRTGGAIEYIKQGVPVTVKQSNNITIKKYTGVINPKYMQTQD